MGIGVLTFDVKRRWTWCLQADCGMMVGKYSQYGFGADCRKSFGLLTPCWHFLAQSYRCLSHRDTYRTALQHRLIKFSRKPIRITPIKQFLPRPLRKDPQISRIPILCPYTHALSCISQQLEPQAREFTHDLLSDRIPRLFFHPSHLLLHI